MKPLKSNLIPLIMRQQNKKWEYSLSGIVTQLTLSFLLSFFFASFSWAQSNLNLNDQSQRINANGSYQDFKIPNSKQYLYLEARGADGGRRGTSHYNIDGGEGANIGAEFTIGTGSNQLAPGGIIRFVIGHSGHSATTDIVSSSGGGGGTGILYLPPNAAINIANNWKLLIVAGGGGGAIGNCCTNKAIGIPGQIGDPGDGKTRNGGGLYANDDGSGEEAYHPLPVGGQGGSGYQKGGFGFGGGGGAIIHDFATYAGGGGGYSGGDRGIFGLATSKGADGGTSYINTSFALGSSIYKKRNSTTTNPLNGYAIYIGTNSNHINQTAELIHQSSKKCIDLEDGNAPNGGVIHLWDCYGGVNQKWFWHSGYLRSKVDYNKCIDLPHGNTSNGTSLQIWDCQYGLDKDHQQWLVDLNTGLIKYKANPNKCIDLAGGNTGNGAKIQIWDCDVNNSNQQWARSYQIKLSNNTKKCIDLADSNAPNGAEIHLWDCNGGAANQKWLFTYDQKIRSLVNPNKCLDFNGGNQTNGTKIHIWDCVETNSQQWQADELGYLRLSANTNKCIDLDSGNTNNGTKIQIWDCQNGNINQLWVIQ